MNYFSVLRKLFPMARKVYKDKNRFKSVVDESMRKSNKVDLFKEISHELRLVFGLLKDYRRGNYRNIKKKDIFLMLAALLYLLNPADIIPDFIIGVGFVDDLSVLAYIIKKLKDELEKYRIWKENARS
ncbi:DUF1232 domain-containing protein [Peptoniphilus sp. MSJ-1]|uniref:DUF1232 domain-containing protein n=1 Tax=Peptoniphilus ovalis TaxID=2841503 RepID=A0ABS6FJ07_9FIRM|nr:DUF1232 domain-containing protein [Peptoniphilus ovalis]MBU5669418.1 DUF1232 domain-containing protein [Peptoniphilus ovalis]